MCVNVCVSQKQPRASLLHNARQIAIHDSSWMAKLSTSTFTLSLFLPNVGEFYAECLNEELPKWHHRCMGVVRIVEIIHFTAAQLPCKVPRMDGCLHLAKRPPNMAISAVFQWHRYGIDGAPFWKHKHMKSYEIIRW